MGLKYILRDKQVAYISYCIQYRLSFPYLPDSSHPKQQHSLLQMLKLDMQYWVDLSKKVKDAHPPPHFPDKLKKESFAMSCLTLLWKLSD